MMAFAPPRLSMTSGWPSTFSTSFAMIRALASVAPPGGKGTMRRIGRSGQACLAPGTGVCASTSVAGMNATSASVGKNTAVRFRTVIFSSCCRMSRRSGLPLLQRNARLLDDMRPAGDIRADELIEFLPAHRRGIHHELAHALLEIGHAQDRSDIGLQLVEHGGGCGRRRAYAIPRIHFEVGEPGLLDRRHVGQRRGALCARDCK